MPQPQMLVARAHEKFDDTGHLTDDDTRNYLDRFLRAFATWMRRVQQEGQ